ncbi:MAG: PfkB family carbohydrate kinase [Acidobacteriota bacterium]|nr:PfkB family carbohydrate kinase [Acidobacteriota bacterium]
MRRFIERAPSVRVLVAGDVMLDAYISGAALRISPEAPVPVVGVTRRRYVPGGAANVAANIAAMGAGASVAGVTGVDESAILLRTQLDGSAIDSRALMEDTTRPTTTKTRVTAGGQQIVRFDDEERLPIPADVEAALCAACLALMENCGAVVISDYAKGVVTDTFCGWLIAEASKRGMPIVIDPKSRELARYRGATVVTPNLKETSAAARRPIENTPDLMEAVELLLPTIAPSALLITRGEDGMSLFEPAQPVRHLPAVRNEVADVTGAGDTVVGVLAIALGMGLDLVEAACMANIAAGVAVGHHGTWAVNREEFAEAAARLDLSALLAAAPL